MAEMGLRPDRGHVKCARVVGDVMGKLHPHGDTAIYDALVRMAQPCRMRLPLIDGHGNFGSLGTTTRPRPMRYTECRLDAGRDADDRGRSTRTSSTFGPTTTTASSSPRCCRRPSPTCWSTARPASRSAWRPTWPPHNLVEVISAARHLIKHPDADLDDLMRFVPGPDLPTGGKIVGLDGIRDAYETGRGTFRTRATARVENVTPRRKGIVVTELPYGVGPERVIEKIAELVRAKKLQGITDRRRLHRPRSRACGWSSRSRTASTPRRSSTSSTG